MDAGFYVRVKSENVSPVFVIVKTKKSDDPQNHNLKSYFKRNFNFLCHKTMDKLIHELEEPVFFRLFIDVRELKKESYLTLILFLVLKKWLLGLQCRRQSIRKLWISSIALFLSGFMRIIQSIWFCFRW